MITDVCQEAAWRREIRGMTRLGGRLAGVDGHLIRLHRGPFCLRLRRLHRPRCAGKDESGKRPIQAVTISL